MKLRLILSTALVLALSAPALALNDTTANGNSGVVNQGNMNHSTINNGSVGSGAFSPSASASSHNTNVNTAVGGSARQEQGQVQGQVQGQTATSGVTGSGNSSVTIKDRKQAPAVFAPGLSNGYDCNGSASFGGSVAGFGIGGGSTVVSEACENVFLFRVLKAEGDADAAWGVLCETDKVRKHSSKCDKYRDTVATAREEEYPTSASVSPKH